MKCDICGCQGAQPRTQTQVLKSGQVLYIDWTVCARDSCLEEMRR